MIEFNTQDFGKGFDKAIWILILSGIVTGALLMLAIQRILKVMS